MKKYLLAALCTTSLFAHAQMKDNDMNQHLTTTLSPSETIAKLTEVFKAKGMTIFAVIDHQQAAKEAGLEMQPATVIIYGNPKAGTPLMKQDPEFALQLPLKVLVTKNHEGKTEVIFASTAHLIANSHIDAEQAKNSIGKAETLIENTLKESTQ